MLFRSGPVCEPSTTCGQMGGTGGLCGGPRYPQMGDRPNTDSDLVSSLVALLIVLFLFFGCAWIKAGHEAEAFNRLTNGPKVTTWDAVWLDLRVEAR